MAGWHQYITDSSFSLRPRSECAHLEPCPVCLSLSVCDVPPRQRALLEQKQKKKRQEPLMVQSTVDGRSRARRTKQSEEQAPLVESYLSSNSSTIYNGEEEERPLPVSGVSEMRLWRPADGGSGMLLARRDSCKYDTIYGGLFPESCKSEEVV